MQYLEVISVNVWQILISLINLVLLFVIIKRFLFKPVNTMLSNRQAELDKKYNDAENLKRSLDMDRALWDKKMESLGEEADDIRKKAVDAANKKSDKLLSDAKMKADSIIRQAEEQARFELKKAQGLIKTQIVDVSSALAGKILEREISQGEHGELIDSFIEKLGDYDEQDW